MQSKFPALEMGLQFKIDKNLWEGRDGGGNQGWFWAAWANVPVNMKKQVSSPCCWGNDRRGRGTKGGGRGFYLERKKFCRFLQADLNGKVKRGSETVRRLLQFS